MKKMPAVDFKSGVNSLPVIGRGVLLALGFSTAVFLLASLVLSFTAVSENIVPYISFVTSIISIFIGSFFVTRKLSYKGWLNGGMTGLFYVLIILILGLLIAGEFPAFAGFATKTFLGFAFGAISGIIGMNV